MSGGSKTASPRCIPYGARNSAPSVTSNTRMPGWPTCLCQNGGGRSQRGPSTISWPRLGARLAAVFGLATVGAFLGLSHRRRTLLGFVLVWGVLVGWWSTITPSNDRDWQPDVAVLPSATVEGDRVTLHNIRNIAYRTATDFTPRYYDKTFDLRRLESVDLISSYWAGEAIAHIFGSFGFGGQDYVT